MLGVEIIDPDFIEGSDSGIKGMGYLNIRSEFYPEKTLRRVNGRSLLYNSSFAGYEIHHGKTDGNEKRFAVIKDAKKNGEYYDGHYSFDERVWGTYIHGIFDSRGFLEAFLNAADKTGSFERTNSFNFGFKATSRWENFLNFADIVKKSLDMEYIGKIARIIVKT